MVRAIQQNFITKMEDIKDMKTLIGLMLTERETLVNNICMEKNFKLA